MLRDLIKDGITASQLVLHSRDFTGHPIAEILDAYFPAGRLAVQNVQQEEVDHGYRFTGIAEVLSVINAQVIVELYEDELVHIRMTVHKLPLSWRMSTSFPAMGGSVADELTFRNPRFTLDSSYPDPLPTDFQVDLGHDPNSPEQETYVRKGLSFEGEVDLGPLHIGVWLLNGERITVRGSIESKSDCARMWLRSELGGPSKVGPFEFPLGFEVVSFFNPDMTWTSYLRLTADFGLESSTGLVRLPMAARLYGLALDLVTLEASTKGISFPSLSDLAGLLAGDEIEALLPDDLPVGVIVPDKIHITLFVPAKAVASVLVEFGLVGQWSVMAGVECSDLRVRIAADLPATPERVMQATLLGRASVGSASFDAFIQVPSLSYRLTMAPDSEIDLSAILATFGADFDGLPDLVCDRLSIGGMGREGSFALLASLSGDWSIPLGVTEASLTEIGVHVLRTAGSGVSGLLWSKITIGGFGLRAEQRLPGGLILNGTVPSLQLADFVDAVCGEDTTRELNIVKDLLQVELRDVTFIFDPGEGSFSATGVADDIGELSFAIRRSGGQWGFAAGVRLKGSFTLGDFSEALSFLDGVQLDQAYMLVSSYAYAQKALPTQPHGSVERVEKGLNFYVPLQLASLPATSFLEQNILGARGVQLALRGAVSNAGSALLEASMAGFTIVDGLEVTRAGLRIQAGRTDVAFGVFGTVTANFADALVFTTEMTVEPTGAYLSATMEGTWKDPFGIKGLTLEDVALQVGLSTTGVPAIGVAGTTKVGGFSGSAAILYNAVDPIESVLAVKFDELSTTAILNTFLSPSVRKSIPSQLRKLVAYGYEDVDVYIVPETTRIGQLVYEQGFRVRGTSKLLGFTAEVDAQIDYQTGIEAYASLTPIQFGRISKGRYVFELTAADSDLFTDKSKKKGQPRGALPSYPVDDRPPPASATDSAPARPSRSDSLGLRGIELSARASRASNPSFFFAESGPVTVELWIYIDKAGKGDSAVFCIGEAGTGSELIVSRGRLIWQHGPGSHGRVTAKLTHVGRWTHIALVTEGDAGAAQRIFIDGREVATSKRSAGPQAELRGLTFGGSRAFRGRIAEFRIWRGASSATRIDSGRFVAAVDGPDLLHHDPLGGGEPSSLELTKATWSERVDAPPDDPSYALELSGVDTSEGALTCGAAEALLAGTATVEAWIRPNHCNHRQTIIHEARSFELALLAKGAIAVGSGGKRQPTVCWPAAVPRGRWTHVAVVRRRKRVELVVDGQTLGAKPMEPASPGATAKLRIGGRARGKPFAGCIDEVRLWSVPRDPASIAATRSRRVGRGQTGLSACWRFDEGEGPDCRDTVRGRIAALGKARWGTSWSWPPIIVDRQRRGLTFGAGERRPLQHSDLPGFARTGLTIELWIKSLDKRSTASILAYSGGPLLLSNPKALTVRMGRSILASTTPINDGQWHHVALTWRRRDAVATLYVDGAAKKTGRLLATCAPRGTVTIGGGTKATIAGDLSDVRLWSTVRSATQIAECARDRLRGLEPGLVALWPLSDGAELIEPRAATSAKTEGGAPRSKLGGPQARLSLTTQEVPSALMSGRIAFLGFFEQEALARADSTGIAFLLERKAGSTYGKMNCRVSSDGFVANGDLQFSLGFRAVLEAPGTGIALCRVDVRSSLRGKVDVSITKDSFLFGIEGSFQWKGHTMTMPRFAIEVAFRDVEALIDKVVQHLKDIAYELFERFVGTLKDLLDAVDKGLVSAGKAIGQSAKVAARAMADAYGATTDAATIGLRKMGYAAGEVGDALAEHFTKSTKAAIEALRGAGFSPGDVGKGIKGAFTSSSRSAAKALEKAGYGARDVGKALKGGFTSSTETAAKALEAAGFKAKDIGRGLQNTFTNDANKVGKALKAAGVDADDTAEVMRDVFKASSKDVASFMKGSWGKSDKAVKDLLKGAGYASREVDSAMKDVFGWGKKVLDSIF